MKEKTKTQTPEKAPLEQYWALRLEEVRKALEENNFRESIDESREEAAEQIFSQLTEANPSSVSYGGSMSLQSLGVLDKIAEMKGVQLLRPDGANLSLEEKLELRRQGLLVDLYFTGSNAVTEEGHLVNLDMIGNRVGALTFGPKRVIVVAGRNKIVPDLETAMNRVKDLAAPANTMRLKMKTPCVKTSHCHDCKSPSRICNTWTITEKSFPKGRISVILINEELGL